MLGREHSAAAFRTTAFESNTSAIPCRLPEIAAAWQNVAMPDLPTMGQLEIIRPDYPRGPFQIAVIDFDGTLSLLRANWQGIMIPMMVEILAATSSGESRDQLRSVVEEFVTRLTGEPTIVQMQALANEIASRGQSPLDPLEYLAQYHAELLKQTAQRIAAIQSGKATADEMMVPGSRQFLEQLRERGMLLVMASGTELADVQREAGILGLDGFFEGRIHGPVHNDPHFSKQRVIEQLVLDNRTTGSRVVAFGDGPAEILAVRTVGGLAIGVASDEIERSGRINPLKHEHLIRAGADIIIPDFQNTSDLLRILFSAS